MHVSNILTTWSGRSYAPVWRVAVIVGLLQAGFGAGFIYQSSVVAEGQRYFCLLDDALISMRYAANWSNGEGLVWNPGERVEGYTNFLWTVVLALCHLPGLSPSNTCLLAQVLGLVVLWCCLAATVVLAQSCRLVPPVACCAVVLVGAYYNLAFFSLFAMETGLLTFFVTLALAGAVGAVRRRRGDAGWVLWFAPALLVRYDVAPLMLFAFAYVLMHVRSGHRRMAMGLLGVTFVMGAHVLWRHSYYGSWLPNTYCMKLTGWPLNERLVCGLRQTLVTASVLGVPLVLAVLAALTRPQRWQPMLMGCFVLTVAYQIYAGGDVWPLDRFIIPATPGLFVLAAQGIHCITLIFLRRKTGIGGTAVRAAAAVLTVAAVNVRHWDHWLLIARPQSTGGNVMNIRYVLALRKFADPDVTIAVSWAGLVPYYSGCHTIDLLGKCDAHIARLPAQPDSRWAGHTKFDLAYSLDTYKPDIVLHALPNIEPSFVRDYQPVAIEVDDSELAWCVRKDTHKVKGGRPVSWRTAYRIIMSIRRT